MHMFFKLPEQLHIQLEILMATLVVQRTGLAAFHNHCKDRMEQLQECSCQENINNEHTDTYTCALNLTSLLGNFKKGGGGESHKDMMNTSLIFALYLTFAEPNQELTQDTEEVVHKTESNPQ